MKKPGEKDGLNFIVVLLVIITASAAYLMYTKGEIIKEAYTLVLKETGNEDVKSNFRIIEISMRDQTPEKLIPLKIGLTSNKDGAMFAEIVNFTKTQTQTVGILVGTSKMEETGNNDVWITLKIFQDYKKLKIGDKVFMNLGDFVLNGTVTHISDD